MAAPAAPTPSAQMLRNLYLLLTGRGAGAVFGVLATVLMAKGLTPAGFGAVALIHATTLLVRGLLNLKPFEAIVRYGADPAQNRGALAQLLRWTRRIDLATAVLASLTAAAALWVLQSSLSIDPSLNSAILWYPLVLLISGTGTAKGLARLQGQFAALGFAQTLAPLVRLAVFVVALLVDGEPLLYLLGFWLGLLVEYAYLLRLGRRIGPSLSLPAVTTTIPLRQLGEQHPGLWRLQGAVYWQSNLDLIPKHALTVIAGTLLGPAAAGHLRLARELASLLTESATLLRQALFPDLTRLATGNAQDRATLKATTARFAGGALLIGVALTVLFALLEESVVQLVASASYAPAGPLAVWLLAAGSIMLAANVLRAAVYALDGALSLLAFAAVGQLLGLLVLLLGSRDLGLAAAGYGAILAALINALGAAWIFHQALSSKPSPRALS